MDTGEAERPGDWPNTAVEDRELPEGLTERMTVLPRGDTADEPRPVLCGKYGFESDDACLCVDPFGRCSEPRRNGLPVVLDPALLPAVVKTSSVPSRHPPRIVPSWS